MRELLGQFGGRVFTLNVTNGYPEFKKVDLGEIFSRDWIRGGRIRFVPNPDVEASRGEASAVFGHLSYLKNAGQVHEWAIVIEQGRDDNERR